MPKHAVLSASGAARWIACPASARLEEQFPESTSSYAEEGTTAHKAAEITTRYFLGQITEDIYEAELQELAKDPYYNKEMQEHAVSYARFVLDKYNSLEDPYADFEVRLDFSKWVKDGFGTGDCMIVSDGVVEIIDFKYGKGVRVSAIENPQMRLYALGVLSLCDSLYDIKKVRATIYQPRLSGEPSTEELTVKELKTWAKAVVVPAAKAAYAGEKVYGPSEEACRFCKAKEQCKARANWMLSEIPEDLEPAELISVEDAAEYLKHASAVKAWYEDLEHLITGELFKGSEVPGWKLVAGRSNRKITDEKEAAESLMIAGFSKDEIYDHKLKSLTQLEKALGAKRVAEALGGLIEKPKGKPSLARDTDPREAYRFDEEILEAFDET